MPTLSGLPGTAGKKEARFFRSPSGAIKAIRDGVAATAANSDGAINVWINDAGAYCCEFHRFLTVVQSERFRSQKRVVEWLKLWMPKMR